MSRYINADELMNWVYEQKVFTGIGTEKGKAVFDAYMKMQRKIFSADVVEVVRCKDCKYSEKDNDLYVCTVSADSTYRKEDHFCSFAKRRESE